jgi:F0F1-type ATP synthase assembly protein I
MAQVGMDLIGPTIVGLVIDWQFGSRPWGTIIGLLVGFVVCLYHLAWIAKRLKNPDQNRPGQGEP